MKNNKTTNKSSDDCPCCGEDSWNLNQLSVVDFSDHAIFPIQVFVSQCSNCGFKADNSSSLMPAN